ncbi:MAG TPA: 4Fe-4S dicluster domain-containing protein [Thermoplasmata archaeon]|nr:4Fe-4S dicluster domain-containing protein [Thermoplasmata archaeon]
MEIHRQVKYEEELDPGFASAVAAEPGGEGIWDCLQCGTCSAICPVSVYMDRTPREIVGLVRAGFREEVLAAVSPWICTSCYACTVECPAGIRITDIMYIVKRMAMKEGIRHRFVIPAIEEAFVEMVRRHGRLTEGRMGIKVAWKSGLRNAASMVPVAWKLLRKDRLKILRAERMRDPASLRAVLDGVGARPAKRPTPKGVPA